MIALIPSTISLKAGVREALPIYGVRRRRYQEAVDVFFLEKLSEVLFVDGASVDDASLGGDVLGEVVGHPIADHFVDFLNLVRRGHLAGPNGPHGLVVNAHLFPLLGGDLFYGLRPAAILLTVLRVA
jgi:hypothetical protein